MGNGMKYVLIIATLLAASDGVWAQSVSPSVAAQTPEGQRLSPEQESAYPPSVLAPVRDPTGLYANMGGGSPFGPRIIDDHAFLRRAALDDLEQVEIGKLAARKGSSDTVRELGRQTVSERQRLNQKLEQLAAQDGVNISDKLNAWHEGRVGKLARLEGAQFDKAFLKEQAHAGHNDAAEFREEAQHGGDATVRQFAARFLPMIESHAQVAKNLEAEKVAAEQPGR